MMKFFVLVMAVLFVSAHFSFQKSFASEDVRHTKHNLAVNPDILAGEGNDFVPGGLTSLRGARNPAVRGTEGDVRQNEEVCIFCHTPHGGRSNELRHFGIGGFPARWFIRLITVHILMHRI